MTCFSRMIFLDELCDAVLVTDNVKDFEGLSVNLENWVRQE